MTPAEALTFSTLLGMAAGYLLWLIPGPCRCAKCAFHTNELNIARLKRAEEIEDQRARDEMLRHEHMHKGAVAGPDDPDVFDCPSRACARNRGRQPESTRRD